KKPRAIAKKAGVLELDATTHLQAQMAAITSEISKLRVDINKPKVDVCDICTRSHNSSNCQATLEEVQFVQSWRPQQSNNWNNQKSNNQRPAQPPGFQNQPFRVKEEDWIKVGNVLASLDATIKTICRNRPGASGEIFVEEGRMAVDDSNLEESAAAHSIEKKKDSCPAAKLLLQ
ncbi:OLC1v1024355C1, partial [Oldenlandia corymbosa var. corymbosa]